MTGLDVDRLDGAVSEVVTIGGRDIAAPSVRAPHRHAYHELLWVRAGEGEHLVDGDAVPIRPGTITVIGRGRVHQFARARGVHGAVVRFADAALAGAGGRVAAGWLVAGRGGRAVEVPAGEHARVDALCDALAAELARPADRFAADVQRHLLSTLLLWVERWHAASRAERRDEEDEDAALHRRFAEVLEADFARHHDAAHYADALAVPAAALSKALARATGRTTKELVLDRVMLEAQRLLRFTDLSVGEVAHRAGFADALYFSRAFKRHAGASPQAYRDALRGSP